MNPMLYISLAYLIAYVIGGIPTSVLAGKLNGIDITKHGSGNAGATNALRVLGTKIGVTVMIIDAVKGVIAILVGRLILQAFNIDSTQIYDITLGVTAILGHVFSIYLKFKGGKGVATAAGVYALLSPIAFAIALMAFIIIVAISRYVSLGSICAALVLFVSQLVINFINNFEQLPILLLTFFVALFIILKHKQNIIRLLNGNENKLVFKPK
ncbi:glycerol-3-phosphate 1-O-acyltransferase PlsY [bacterium]|nr:glycerol-3-phosphate 1-O-acyltransferase PlsY [bacterium]